MSTKIPTLLTKIDSLPNTENAAIILDFYKYMQWRIAIETVDSMLNKFEAQGKTAILAAIDNNLAEIIALADTIKGNAKDAINSLKSMGIEVVMLTGDNKRTANAVASKLGIDKVIAQVLPQEKEQEISKLKEQGKKIVAMDGDGINDAPALAQANLGIAIGSGTDVAKLVELF